MVQPSAVKILLADQIAQFVPIHLTVKLVYLIIIMLMAFAFNAHQELILTLQHLIAQIVFPIV